MRNTVCIVKYPSGLRRNSGKMIRLTFNEIMQLADKVDSIVRAKKLGMFQNFESLVEISRDEKQELKALFYVKPQPMSNEIIFTISEAKIKE